MILVIDNHGFTTRILAHQLGAVQIIAATELADLHLEDYTHVVIGHGTGRVGLEALISVPIPPVLTIDAGYQHMKAAYEHRATARAHPIYVQLLTHNHSDSGSYVGHRNPTALISYHRWRLVSIALTQFRDHATDETIAVQ